MQVNNQAVKTDIILAGVGGQGILSVATIIGHAALENKLYLKQAETHGMSQRGGDVQSHLRISKQNIASDLVPIGSADLVLSSEPMEALRYLPFLAPNGYIITSCNPFVNVPNYPDQNKVIDYLRGLPRTILLDAEQLAKDAGNARAANVVMLGAAAPLLILPFESLENGIRAIFQTKGHDVVEMNLKALKAGHEAVKKQLAQCA